MPAIVTTSGRLFILLGITRVGAMKINFEKNHPENIVPMDRRIRAPFRLLFSSLIGERGEIVGLARKQNKIIRKL